MKLSAAALKSYRQWRQIFQRWLEMKCRFGALLLNPLPDLSFAVVIPCLLFLVPTPVLAQNNKLTEIELHNMGGSYRIQIACESSVSYVDRFNQFQNKLTLFLANTRLALPQRELRFTSGFVGKIRAAEWRQSPPISKIEIFFTEVLTYRIHTSIEGVILVDLERRHSQKKYEKTARRSGGKAITPTVKETGVVAELPAQSGALEVAAHWQSKSLNENTRQALPLPLRSLAKISLDVRAAEISNVLRLLAKQSKLNIVAGSGVTGKVTVTLNKVSLKDALDLIVKASGLDYTIEGDVVLVKPREQFNALELETKVYRLKYLDANNLKGTVAQVLSPQAKVQVFYHNFREVDLDKSAKETGEKNRSSTLIVTDSAVNIKQLDAMIAALDVPAPQIMIEAKLVEISPQHEKKLGINWDKSINAEIFREIITPSGQPFQYSAEIPVDGGSVNYGTLSVERYNAVLNFLSANTNSKLVSNPRIMATDNQEAMISVGTTFPIPQITRGVGGQGDIVTFEYRDVNIELRVTPHVGEDESISLYVNPQVEEVIGQVSAGDNSAPITSKRTVETVVNLKNNETMVIGGLIRENTIDTVQKVWLLGDIPLIGNLFRQKSVTKKQTDLLIFITPRLVNVN